MKNVFLLGFLGMFVLGIIGVISVAGMWISYSNKETILRNQITSQIKANEVVFDNMWKTISQLVQVSDDYKNSFKEIYVDIAKVQNPGTDGKLMKWIKQSNPNFDISLYSKVANAIEGKRAEFTESQKKLIDLGREHDNLLTVMPGSLFLFNKQHIDLKIVTSSRTEKTFESGKDDNVNIRGN